MLLGFFVAIGQGNSTMNRRNFVRVAGLSAFAAGFGGVPALARKAAPQFSITMDDFFWQDSLRLSSDERNQSILGTLSKHSIKAALFVIGRNVEDDKGRELLSAWDRAGHMIANHTYSHRNLNAREADVKEYQDDILHAEALLKDFPRFRKYLRFPMLKEGDTVAKRDAMRAFLAEHGYRNGHVTIDDSDWYINQRLTTRLKEIPRPTEAVSRLLSRSHVDARGLLQQARAACCRVPGQAHFARALQPAQLAVP